MLKIYYHHWSWWHLLLQDLLIYRECQDHSWGLSHEVVDKLIFYTNVFHHLIHVFIKLKWSCILQTHGLILLIMTKINHVIKYGFEIVALKFSFIFANKLMFYMRWTLYFHHDSKNLFPICEYCLEFMVMKIHMIDCTLSGFS